MKCEGLPFTGVYALSFRSILHDISRYNFVSIVTLPKMLLYLITKTQQRLNNPWLVSWWKFEEKLP